MSRLRLTAAFLACLTMLVAGLFSFNEATSGGVAAGAAFAALCLAVTVPFRADDPPGRKRIFVACVAFVVSLLATLFTALQTAAGFGPVGVLVGLAAAGVALTTWSFKTRNRRRRSGWRNYYDV